MCQSLTKNIEETRRGIGFDFLTLRTLATQRFGIYALGAQAPNKVCSFFYHKILKLSFFCTTVSLSIRLVCFDIISFYHYHTHSTLYHVSKQAYSN